MTPSLLSASLLIAILMMCTHHHPVEALFGRKKPAEDAAADAATNSKPTAEPARPPSIIEAEARTARELAAAVATLTKDLQTCTGRVEAIEEGFQDLYAAHLNSVDGLRKCKEGMLTTEAMSKLSTDLDGVNPALLEQAHAKEEAKKRAERDEKLAERHRELIHELESQVQQLVRRERTWERTISELVARRDMLESREGAWERTIGELMGEIEIRNRRESWWEDMQKDMERRIGALSRIAVVERFGYGPHYVSMVVELEEGVSSSQREIIFQLAPLELTPHSVHIFLSQVADGYWSRGTPAFAINAEHVLQACPHPCLDSVDMGGNVPGYPYGDMKRAGLDTVSFQEYSPQYPHQKYTIGFAGRPHSGPEFYINTLDNTMDHGTLAERKMMMNPTHYKVWAQENFGSTEDVDEKAMEPYPCFGKVVKGFEVVDELAKGLTRASLPKEDESEAEEDESDELYEHILLRPVHIASMTILKDYAPDGEGKGAASDEL
ncbi:hypothetical protein ACHAXT_007282 [Thalassiosira profunda]